MTTTDPNQDIKKITLTQEQKARILTLINARPDKPPSLKELIQVAFPNSNLDGRSFEGRAVKEYCSTLNVITPTTRKPPELTDEQKLYLRNNAQTMTIVEMARALFNKEDICKINLEYKLIETFLTENNIKPYEPQPQVIQRPHFIPKTLTDAARRVNRYVLNAIDTKNLKKDTRTQNYLQALIRYCHKTRYGLMMSTLTNDIDLELFESTFISNVWDKPDLSEEEVDQYINLSCDVVNYTRMQREVDRLTEMRDKCLDDSDGRRLSMALVDQIGRLYEEMDNNFKRQNAMVKVLVGTRNERMAGRLKESASVIQLIDAWRDEEKRKRLIAVAEHRKKVLNETIKELDTMDSISVEIFGLDRSNYE